MYDRKIIYYAEVFQIRIRRITEDRINTIVIKTFIRVRIQLMTKQDSLLIGVDSNNSNIYMYGEINSILINIMKS